MPSTTRFQPNSRRRRRAPESKKGIPPREGTGLAGIDTGSEHGFLYSILEGSPSIIFVKDPNGRYLYVNPEFCKICRLPRAAIMGRTDEELFPEEQAARFRTNDLGVFESGSAREFEEVALQDDGPHTSIVSKFPLRDQEGRVFGVCGIATDVTEWKKAENALRESEERFRLLAEGVKDYAILMLDSSGHILSWNIGAKRIKGYDSHEVIGKHLSILYPPEAVRAGKPDRALKIALAEGRFEEEGPRMRKDGSRFWASVTITALRDQKGTHRGFAKVTRDITERKKAEEALRDLSGQLLKAQDDERRRISTELHDNTSPTLTTLIGKLYAAKRIAREVDDKIEGLLDESLTLAEHTSSMIRSVSYLLYPPLLDERGLLVSLRLYLEQLASQPGLHIALESPDEVPRLSRDAERAMFRVVQESLASIPRGSRWKARVRLVVDKQQVVLESKVELAERGSGAAVKAPEPSVGLAGVREVLRQLGGHLELEADPSGMSVTAVVPRTLG
jgi:PAS domain S-box-containing protein